jgi:hypothetical protein
MREKRNGANRAPECPSGLDKAQRPRSETVVSGSFGVEGAHVGGAGNGVIKGTLAKVFYAAPRIVHPCDPRSASQSR